MSTAQQTIFLLVSDILLLAALAGLWFRRRMRLVYFFPAYLLAVVVLGSLMGLWRERFLTWSFYWAKEAVYTLLKVSIAFELTVRVFRAFPAARRTARRVILVVLAITILTAWRAAPEPTVSDRGEEQWANLVVTLNPRISNGTAWLFGGLFALILYYRLPLHPLHKAVAFGFMAYLLLLAYALDLLKRSQFDAFTTVIWANALGYLAVAGYWAWAAWRRDPPPLVDPDVVSRLQPWREEDPPNL